MKSADPKNALESPFQKSDSYPESWTTKGKLIILPIPSHLNLMFWLTGKLVPSPGTVF